MKDIVSKIKEEINRGLHLVSTYDFYMHALMFTHTHTRAYMHKYADTCTNLYTMCMPILHTKHIYTHEKSI